MMLIRLEMIHAVGTTLDSNSLFVTFLFDEKVLNAFLYHF